MGEDGKPFYFAGQIHSISKKNLIGIAASSDEEAQSGYIYDFMNENHLGDYFKKEDMAREVSECEVEYDLVYDGSSEKAVIHAVEGKIPLT